MPDQALQRLTPDCRVSVDNQPLPAGVEAALTRVSVDLDADFIGQCALIFNDPQLELIDGARFASGMPVSVELGFGVNKQRVFAGEVVALEPEFRRDRPPSLRVVCQESLHRLALSPMTRTFNNADDHEIVTAIAQEHGLSGDAPQGTRTNTLQANISDARFLAQRANQHGNRVRIEGTRLVIAPPGDDDTGVTLSPGDGVKKLKVGLHAGQQVGAVSAHGWDAANKREISARAEPQGDAGEGAREHGGDATVSVEGDVLPPDVSSAESMARGRMRRIAERYVTAEVEMIGDARLVPGKLFAVDKVDDELDGQYRVSHATHRFDRHGYRLSLRAARLKKKAVPPPPRPAAGPRQEEGWLENPRWTVRERDHGEEAEMVVDAHELEGRQVLFTIEQKAGQQWQRVDELGATVAGGEARVTAVLDHPAVARHHTGRHHGAVAEHLQGTRELRFHARLATGGNARRSPSSRGSLRDARFATQQASGGEDVEMTVQADEAEGRTVLFRLEHDLGGGDWVEVAQARATVSQGRASARVRVDHPAAVALHGGRRAQHAQVAGTRALRFQASLAP